MEGTFARAGSKQDCGFIEGAGLSQSEARKRAQALHDVQGTSDMAAMVRTFAAIKPQARPSTCSRLKNAKTN